MPSPARTRATILAHHLYDFAECEHRIALDAALPRSSRTPPDAAIELLFEHGRRFEREVVEPLGYAAVDVVEDDWDRAFDRTLELMRAGVDGIDQGVLLDGSRLARPDLLERVPGESKFGGYHYRPGDVKSARATRSDAALQVGFAGLLLEAVQGRRPESGFLILGDGTREELDLESVRCTIDDAVERAEAIARGALETTPFYSANCARCRWRGECLPRLESSRDLSFVYGLTRSRHRVLRRHGVATIDDLASADVSLLVAEDVPSEGLERAQVQARALLEGRVLRPRAVPIPRGARRELYLRIEVDPLDRGEPFMLGWAEGPVGGGAIDAARVVIASSPAERADGLEAFVEIVEAPSVREEPIFVFGGGTARAFDALAETCGLEPARAGDLAGRFVDLAPWVRRAGVLPVFSYAFDEVAAVARASPRPSPGAAADALFVLHAGLAAADDPAGVRAVLEAEGRDSLESLRAIRAWIAHPARAGGAR
jgi:predicted RecB family nuclease